MLGKRRMSPALAGAAAVVLGAIAMIARPAAAAEMIGNCELFGTKGSIPMTPAS